MSIDRNASAEEESEARMDAQLKMSKPPATVRFMHAAAWCRQLMLMYTCSRHTPNVRKTVSARRMPLHEHTQTS